MKLCFSVGGVFAHFSSLSIDAYSDIDARLVVKKYVEKGSGVTLYCKHNVDPKILDKVRPDDGLLYHS